MEASCWDKHLQNKKTSSKQTSSKQKKKHLQNKSTASLASDCNQPDQETCGDHTWGLSEATWALQSEAPVWVLSLSFTHLGEAFSALQFYCCSYKTGQKAPTLQTCWEDLSTKVRRMHGSWQGPQLEVMSTLISEHPKSSGKDLTVYFARLPKGIWRMTMTSL